MRILLLTYNDAVSLSGAFTSMIDLYLNLKNFIEVDMKIMFDIHSTGMLNYFRVQNFFGNIDLLSTLTKDRNHESDTVIISSELLGQIIKGLEINIKCDRLIILDSLDLQKVKFNLLPDLTSFLFCDNCVLLSNPANFNILSVKTLEYYHKFNPKRLLSIDWYPKIANYDRRDKKHSKMKDNVYVENIGKSIFESIFLGNQINYHANELPVEDGLCSYLRLFGIDPHIDHFPLKIKKEEIKEKLFFSEKDKVLEIL
jgi:hypothetical protein